MRITSPRCRLALVVLVVSLLASSAGATWSIVVVDKNTGEVAIGCATCVPNDYLELWVPVMLTGIGGACAQASGDGTGQNRRTIWDEMLKGTHPRDILEILKLNDNRHQSRQYGIVDLQGRRRTFTGANCSAWAGGVVGRAGSMVYAIQGNILVSDQVVLQAEVALLGTPGDLAEKLMAAMEAAAAFGGDNRCTRYGKTSHVGFMMISRIGDQDGDCDVSIGCANGTYYMNLDVADQGVGDIDPVIQLRGLFDSWRDSWRGRPDHLLTVKALTRDRMPGNGNSLSTLNVALVDWENNPITTGGAAITVSHDTSSAGLSSIGDPVDHGDGTYSVPITAGAGQGTDVLRVEVDDGLGAIQLYPNPTLELTDTLTADVADLSAGAGGVANLSLFGPEDAVGRHYLVLASASGTDPGLKFGDVVLPLNLDPVLLYSYVYRNGSVFVATEGNLAPDGTGAAQFVAPPGVLQPLVGGELAFAWLALMPIDFASNPVTIAILP